MKRMKKITALGLSVCMMSAMAVGIHADSGDRLINGRGEGDTKPAASADIDVDGYLTADPIIDPSGSVVVPSDQPTYIPTSSSVLVPSWTVDPSGSSTQTLVPTNTAGNGPVDGDGSQVSWGDESTKNSTQLIMTAPTKLSFQVAGRGDDANIQTTENGKNVTGKIKNQSCYVDEDLLVVPKEVEVKGTANIVGTGAFELVADSASLPTDGSKTAIKGVYLNLGGEKTDFALMTAEQTLGTLAKGTKAITADNKWAVNPSETEVSFTDKDGGSNGVSTAFANDYDGANLKTSYNVNMVYSVK